MRDKFSELASVVRRLSAPGNAAADLPETSDRYELEVDGILRDAAGKLAGRGRRRRGPRRGDAGGA